MIRLFGKIPHKIYVACSGGPDSMAALDFLRRSKRDIRVCYFDHNTSHSLDAQKLVEEYCNIHGLNMSVGSGSREKNKTESWEEHWRNERLGFFHSLARPVVTGHTLDDVCEWWIFTSLSGNPQLIPRMTRNVLHPFMLTTKQDLHAWCIQRDVEFIEDPSNFNDKFMRSFIRKNMMPHALYVNPGFHKVIRKKLLAGLDFA